MGGGGLFPDGPIRSCSHRKDIFCMGNSSSALKKKKEGHSVFLAFSVLQVPLTQNSQHARAANLGVVYSASLHW